MDLSIVLSIVGAFGVLALSINGYFLRGIFQDLTAVKVLMATMSARSEAKEKRLDNIETNQKEIFERLNKVERGNFFVISFNSFPTSSNSKTLICLLDLRPWTKTDNRERGNGNSTSSNFNLLILGILGDSLRIFLSKIFIVR